MRQRIRNAHTGKKYNIYKDENRHPADPWVVAAYVGQDRYIFRFYKKFEHAVSAAVWQ